MSVNTSIPFVDLASQRDEIADEVAAGFERVLATTGFIGGPEVAGFEAEFASYCGVGHCIGAANGTDAIEMLLRGLDIGRGDEVVIPANTFIATAEATARAGADVVLADCADDTLLIDPKKVAERITPKTRAVLGVDLYGQIAPFEQLAAVVPDGVLLLEDAAQSQGALRNGSPIGAGVRGAATSFYPGKNLGAFGDAGAVITDDAALAEVIRAIGGHGGNQRYQHDVFGFNSRLDALQAVVLRAKLKRLDAWNSRRREAARRYDELLAGESDVIRPFTDPANEHVWHLYVVRVPQRDRVLAAIQADGVGAGIHYPSPVHRTGAFSSLNYGEGDFPVAEAAASSMLSLPMHPHLAADDQERAVASLLAAIG